MTLVNEPIERNQNRKKYCRLRKRVSNLLITKTQISC